MRKWLSMILALTILLSMVIVGSAAAEEAKISIAQAGSSVVSVGENVSFYVFTTLEARHIALFDEAGNQLADWSADRYSVRDGNQRVWEVIMPTDAVGEQQMLIKASADGMNYTHEMKVSFTVTEDAAERISSGLPEISSVSNMLYRNIEAYETLGFKVYTSDNAKVLTLVDENGEVLESWTADESAVYVKAGECKWLVYMRPDASGELRYTFCASEDGVTYGETKSSVVTVNELDASVYSEYLGTWYGVSMTEGGESYTFAELGMDMTLTVNTDGSITMDMAGDVQEATWRSDYNCIVVEGAPLTLEGDTLTMRDYGSEMVFSREPAGAEAVDLSAYPEYLGDWFCTAMTEGGETVNPAEYGMEVTLTLYADGSAVLDMAGEAETAAWNVNEGGISLMTLQGTLQADGTLVIAEEGTGMVFSRESAAASAPTQQPTTEPVATPAPTQTDEPMIEPEPTDDIGRIDVYKVGYYFSDYLGTWYGMRITEDGQTYDLAELGMDMTLTLDEDCHATLNLSGDVEETTWENGGDCILVEGAPLKLDGDTLMMQQDGTEIIFSRKASVAADLSGYPQYLGDWYCISMTEDGETMNPAEYGMQIVMTLNADGSAILDMAGDVETAAWSPTDAGVSLMTMEGTYLSDGTLVFWIDGTKMVFSREAPAEAPTENPTEGMPDPSAFPEYLGEWYCVSMTEGGETASPADYGMAITLTLNADASGTLDMAGDVKDAAWSVTTDGISVMGLAGTLQADGTLILVEEGAELIFSREKPEGAQTDGGVDMSAYADYIGTWVSEADGMSVTILEDGTATVEVNGEITNSTLTEDYGYLYFGDTMLRMQYDGKLLWSAPDTDVFLIRAGEEGAESGDEAFDMTPYTEFIGMWGDGEITLTITEDGEAELTQNGETRAFTLGEEYGYLKVDDLYLIMQSDGTLSVSGDIFAVLYRDGILPTPKPLPTSATTPEPTSEPTQEPPPEPTPMPMPTIEPISIADRMDKRFVCTGADMEGYLIDASMLGGEYAMTFHEDGRMELVLAGMEIPGGCAWETATVTDENGTEQTAFIIDYFGMDLEAVLTDTGFEMNYMDSMLMHFELEEEKQ